MIYIDEKPYTIFKENGEVKLKEGTPENYMFSINLTSKALQELLGSRDYSGMTTKMSALKAEGQMKVSFPRGGEVLKEYAVLGMFEALRRLGYYV